MRSEVKGPRVVLVLVEVVHLRHNVAEKITLVYVFNNISSMEKLSQGQLRGIGSAKNAPGSYASSACRQAL